MAKYTRMTIEFEAAETEEEYEEILGILSNIGVSIISEEDFEK